MSNPQKETLAIISPQQRLFVLGDEELTPHFLWHYLTQVPAGEMWLSYCDGLLVEQLRPGRHTWWSSPFRKWRILKINTRVELFDIAISGRVKPPPVPTHVVGAGEVEMACDVTAELAISCQVANVETFLQYRDPFSIFLASLSNMVVDMIGSLPYDQYGQWARTVRDEVKRRLIRGSDDAESRLGIRVSEVFVTEFKPNAANDRNMLAMFQAVERGRRELVEAQANAQRDQVVASSYATQGDVLNISPAILALQNSPIGRALIERDADLRKLLVASGLAPAVNVQPLQDTPAQLSGGQPSSMAYLNPPRPAAGGMPPNAITGFLAQSGSLPTVSQQVSGSLSPVGSFPTGPMPPLSADHQTPAGPLAPTQPAHSDAPPVDGARQREEMEALTEAGFTIAEGKVTPMYDETGVAIPGTSEWAISVYARSSSGHFSIIFHCPAGYPAHAPSVQLKRSGASSLTWIEPNAVRDWHPGRLLVEVAQEICTTIP
jgi:hypothetical protein